MDQGIQVGHQQQQQQQQTGNIGKLGDKTNMRTIQPTRRDRSRKVIQTFVVFAFASRNVSAKEMMD